MARAGIPALTPKRMALIEQHLRAGLWRANAAELAGIAMRTLQTWMAKGSAELEDAGEELERSGAMPRLGKYARFAATVLAVEAETEAKMVGVVVTCTRSRDKDLAFKAATWWLERKRPLVYGKAAMRVDLQVGDDTSEADDADVAAAVLERLEAVEGNVIRIAGATGGGSGSS
jgi:hypothetical protein